MGEPAREELVYTGHARRQMHERQIQESDIEHVPQQYDIHRPAPSRGAAKPAEIYIGESRGRRLKVYVERDSKPRKIKTAVWEGD
jgi:hypothetical protein